MSLASILGHNKNGVNPLMPPCENEFIGAYCEFRIIGPHGGTDFESGREFPMRFWAENAAPGCKLQERIVSNNGYHKGPWKTAQEKAVWEPLTKYAPGKASKRFGMKWEPKDGIESLIDEIVNG